LTTYKTSTGKIIEEHPLLPTQEQCDLMDEFVQSMDLDAHALKLAEASYQEGQRTVEERLA
jgi:ATP-dependent DNA helicase 2 subunit 2